MKLIKRFIKWFILRRERQAQAYIEQYVRNRESKNPYSTFWLDTYR